MTIFSPSRGFLFISNTKVASSTLHHLLYPVADAVFYRPEVGKHFSYAQARDRLHRWGGPDAASLFRFGVVREPVDWVRSWYKFRSRADMRAHGGRAMPEGTRFTAFVDAVLADDPPGYARIREQVFVFRDRKKTLSMDFLATLDGIREDGARLARYPALKALDALRDYRVNTSETAEDLALPARTRARLEAFLAADCELYQAVRDGAYRDLPETLPARPCTLALDADDLAEDAISRMTLAANLGRHADARLWANRIPASFELDPNSRSVLEDVNNRPGRGRRIMRAILRGRDPRFWRRRAPGQ